jgi:predicted enzyme related to lactoylglutathione lyase
MVGMGNSQNAINWFEIPATDFDRAAAFYGNILGRDLLRSEEGPIKMAFLGEDPANPGGALSHGPGMEPGDKGTVVYLNGGDDLSVIMDRVEPAGGQVLIPKTKISDEYGYFGMFLDTEGNRVGLHNF